MSIILILLILAGVGGAIYYYSETQATKDVKRTTLPPSQIIRQAVQEIGTQRRYVASGHSSDFASFTFKQHANCLIAILLAFLFVIPGILYFLLANRSQSLTINVFPEGDGTTNVQVSASGGETKRRGRRFLRALPDAAVVTTGGMQQTPALAQPAVGTSAPTPLAAPTPAAELPPASTAPQAAPPPPAELTTPQTATQEIPPSSTADTAFCQDCGAQMGASHKFCPECGKEQSVG